MHCITKFMLCGDVYVVLDSSDHPPEAAVLHEVREIVNNFTEVFTTFS